jgi:hypothetical protein
MARRTLILAAASLLVALAGACGGGDSGSEDSDAGGFRAFAAQIQQALDANDSSFFAERMLLDRGTCEPADLTPGIGQRPCTAAGAPWEGFRAGFWRSDGFYITGEGAISGFEEFFADRLPDASDDFGDGKLRVYALEPGAEAAAAIVTALIERPADFAGDGPLRVVAVMSWSKVDGQWRWTSLLRAAVLAEEFLIPCEVAVPATAAWERYPDPTAPRGDPEDCPL